MLANQGSREDSLQADIDCHAGYDNQDIEEDVVFDGGYQVPGSIYSRLFDYQKTGKLPQALTIGMTRLPFSKICT